MLTYIFPASREAPQGRSTCTKFHRPKPAKDNGGGRKPLDPAKRYNLRGLRRKLLKKTWKDNFLARAARPARAARAAHRLQHRSVLKQEAPTPRSAHHLQKFKRTCKPSGTEARIAEKSLERKFLARASRPARAARAARAAHAAPPATLLGPQARSPYAELGTPILEIKKTCKQTGDGGTHC